MPSNQKNMRNVASDSREKNRKEKSCAWLRLTFHTWSGFRTLFQASLRSHCFLQTRNKQWRNMLHCFWGPRNLSSLARPPLVPRGSVDISPWEIVGSFLAECITPVRAFKASQKPSKTYCIARFAASSASKPKMFWIKMWCPPMGPGLPTAPKFLGRFPKIAILCEAIRPRKERGRNSWQNWMQKRHSPISLNLTISNYTPPPPKKNWFNDV